MEGRRLSPPPLVKLMEGLRPDASLGTSTESHSQTGSPLVARWNCNVWFHKASHNRKLIDSGNYTCGARNVAHERLAKPAVLQIYVDGSWSQWSGWIDPCPTSCKHFDHNRRSSVKRSRFRVCDSPPPSNGGAYCPGADKEHEDCDLLCPVDGSWSTWNDWTTCNIDCYQTRHRRCDSPTPLNGGRICHGFDRQQRNCSDAECMPNILGKSVLLEENSLNVVRSNMTMYAGLAAAVFVFLFAFLVMFALVLRRKTCHRCNKDYEIAPTSPVHVVAANRPDVAMHSPLVYDLAPSMKSDRSRVGLLACKLSVGYATRRNYFGIPCQRRCSNTECLLMSDRGISLFIPEGALIEEDIEVFLLISENRPPLNDRQTALTPAVWLGPAGLTFKKPAFTMFFNGSCDDAFSNQWSPVAVVGQETLNTSTYCQMDQNCCHVLIENSGKYALVGEGKTNAPPVSKRCRLAVFMGDSGLRVYCIADTRAALQWTLAQEEELCGRLCAVQSETLLLKQGSDFCLCLEGLSPGWTLLSASNYQEIPASHLWNSNPALHCTFSLANKENIHCIQDFPLTATLIVCQKGSKSSRSIINIDNEAVWNISDTFREFYAPVRLSAPVRLRLAALLDPPTESGNDWRMLARKLEVDHYLPYFASRPSPTDLILLLWESRQQSSKSVISLMQALRIMQREDAAFVISTYLDQV
ncbi:unnamed protein product [Soboliphyme baturini]|uniref:Netrin receptor UNC5 n=1 Tax=Soboliphyme baturini TaxID=241478 RepID=A0A183IIS7_9BILA|nr:unnamed protein product [Soboliphyme baturini]